MRQIRSRWRRARRAEWQAGVGHSLIGKTLGLYGYRRIAKIVAGYGAAFGMHVLVWARPGRSSGRGPTDSGGGGREEFFADCDVLSLHMRLVPATRGIVRGRTWKRMRPSALLVSTSRAALIEPGALVAAAAERSAGDGGARRVRGGPLHDPSHPLLNMDNVLCTPHIGYVTHEEWELQFADVFDQVNAVRRGRRSTSSAPARRELAASREACRALTPPAASQGSRTRDALRTAGARATGV